MWQKNLFFFLKISAYLDKSFFPQFTWFFLKLSFPLHLFPCIESPSFFFWFSTKIDSSDFLWCKSS
jgi:hypothetical protein